MELLIMAILLFGVFMLGRDTARYDGFREGYDAHEEAWKESKR